MADKIKVKYPCINETSRSIGYNKSYLWRVLEGKPGYSGRAGLAERYWRAAARVARGRGRGAEMEVARAWAEWSLSQPPSAEDMRIADLADRRARRARKA